MGTSHELYVMEFVIGTLFIISHGELKVNPNVQIIRVGIFKFKLVVTH